MCISCGVFESAVTPLDLMDERLFDVLTGPVTVTIGAVAGVIFLLFWFSQYTRLNAMAAMVGTAQLARMAVASALFTTFSHWKDYLMAPVNGAVTGFAEIVTNLQGNNPAAISVSEQDKLTFVLAVVENNVFNESGGAKVGHGSGGIVPLRAA